MQDLHRRLLEEGIVINYPVRSLQFPPEWTPNGLPNRQLRLPPRPPPGTRTETARVPGGASHRRPSRFFPTPGAPEGPDGNRGRLTGVKPPDLQRYSTDGGGSHGTRPIARRLHPVSARPRPAERVYPGAGGAWPPNGFTATIHPSGKAAHTGTSGPTNPIPLKGLPGTGTAAAHPTCVFDDPALPGAGNGPCGWRRTSPTRITVDQTGIPQIPPDFCALGWQECRNSSACW